MDVVETVARDDGPHGEVVLRRRTGPAEVVEELVVNGTFAMDSAETASERALAAVAVRAGARRVLVGGLGLGYTADALRRGPVERVDVVEIEDCLVAWARQGLTPTLARVARDPRVRLHVTDVADVLTGYAPAVPGPWDAILLDVDNGPDFLIHAANAGLYTPPLLRAAYGWLTPGGVLAVWCQGRAPALFAELTRIDPTARQRLHRVHRGRREWSYAIYTVRRQPSPTQWPS